MTVKLVDAFAFSDETFQITTLRHQVPPLLFDTRVADPGRASDTHTFFAVAGPALRTVSVHVAFTLIFTDAGHESEAERSALLVAGGALATVTLCGPDVALPAAFVATTE